MSTLNSHTITHGLLIFKGVREPQAVCQATPADPQAKTWQRVCLFLTHGQEDNAAKMKEN